MTTLVLDQHVSDQLIAQRQAEGRDRWDEVWDGQYIIMPDPDIKHQHLVSWLVRGFGDVWDDADRGITLPGGERQR